MENPDRSPAFVHLVHLFIQQMECELIKTTPAVAIIAHDALSCLPCNYLYSFKVQNSQASKIVPEVINNFNGNIR